jgi:CRP/FNR family transcriptional regulator, cyclic AMP receptor protein
MTMPVETDIKATLRKVQLFASLTTDELNFAAERAVARRYAPDEMVFSEGEPCAGLWMVASGSIRIFKTAASGREQVLAIEGPGSSVAELPVFDGGNYPASASAASETVLVFVAKKDFQSLVLQHPEVALKVLKVVGGRLRRLVGIIEELSFTTVRHRLAAYILRLAKTEGRSTPEGVEVLLPGSQQELASHIGTVRELVSRNVSRLQAEGIIRSDGKQFLVTDLKALERVVEKAE